jgi:hypothetical protein
MKRPAKWMMTCTVLLCCLSVGFLVSRPTSHLRTSPDAEHAHGRCWINPES